MGKADQDRREGRQLGPLHRLPHGGGRHPTGPVRRHLADDRGATTAARGVHGVECSRGMSSSQITVGVRPNGKQFVRNPCHNVGFGGASCTPAALSATAPACQGRQIAGSLHPSRGLFGKSRLI